MKNLSDINVIKSVMGKHGVTFNKGLGQNFLVDPDVCPAMAEAAGLDENTCAIEIGPGVGVLTAELAKRAARALGLDYCGVDILTGNDGKPYFCEANSNAFFRGIEGVTGVNVASVYADYIFDCMGFTK